MAFPEGVDAVLVKLELFRIDGTITTNELYGFEEMTFRARMQCIELFDENGLEMNPKWKWHSKEVAEREHDEKTPNEHDAS